MTGVIEDADADALNLCDCDELGETGMRMLTLHAVTVLYPWFARVA